MSLLASDNVLKKYKKLVQIQETDAHDLQKKQQILQGIILEMRRDLGQLNFAILQGDLDFIFELESTKNSSYETEKTFSTT